MQLLKYRDLSKSSYFNWYLISQYIYNLQFTFTIIWINATRPAISITQVNGWKKQPCYTGVYQSIMETVINFPMNKAKFSMSSSKAEKNSEKLRKSSFIVEKFHNIWGSVVFPSVLSLIY